MNHLNFNIDDPRWAIVIAGNVINAKKDSFVKLNRPFTISLKSTNPLIQYIGEHFDQYNKDIPDYQLPNEEQYNLLDYYSAATIAKNLQEQHGIKQEPNVMPLFLHNLAHSMLLMTHAIASKPGYYFPKFSKSALVGIQETDAIVELPQFIDKATAFCEGLGIASPNVICIQGLDDLTVAKMCQRTKLIVSRPNHLVQYIARANYKGFDFLNECLPVLSVIDNTITPSDRYLVSWNGQIPCLDNDNLNEIKAKGVAYKMRKFYNFDHREFYKAEAKKRKANEQS